MPSPEFQPHRPQPRPDGYVRDHDEVEIPSGITPIYLDSGVSPFGPPKEYAEILEEQTRSGKRLEAGIQYNFREPEEAKRFQLERYGLDKNDCAVIFGQAGSDELLERSVLQHVRFATKKTRIRALAPTFPSVASFVENFNTDRVIYGPVETDLNSSLEESIEFAIKSRKNERGRGGNIHYLCNPSTPKGDFASFEAVKEFSDFVEEMGDELWVDEAFFIHEDQYSAMNLFRIPYNGKRREGLRVFQSGGKSLGLAGDKFGIVGMPHEMAEKFRLIKRHYDVSGPTRLIIDAIMKPEIIYPHYEYVRTRTREIKPKVKQSLKNKGIQILEPTDDDVIIMTVDGEELDFCNEADNVGIILARGWGYRSTNGNINNRYGRLTIPSDESMIEEIAEGLARAKLAAKLKVTPSRHRRMHL